MDNWMKRLSAHYEQAGRHRPHKKLLILFDIDGAILDMRHVILYVLRHIDRKRKTDHFSHLQISDIHTHEEDLDMFLGHLHINGREREQILASFQTDLMLSTAVMDAHMPFPGVFEVIRWFQLQTNTFVGLNTGRPEALRFNTLSSLNNLGRNHGVSFRDDLLYMKPDTWPGTLPEAKVAGVDYFRSLGYLPVAMIDNEPENLEAIALNDTGRGMLLLHADTISKSRFTLTSRRIVRGNSYDPNHLTGGFTFRKSA